VTDLLSVLRDRSTVGVTRCHGWALCYEQQYLLFDRWRRVCYLHNCSRSQQQQDMQSGNERRSTTAPEVPVPPATGVQKKVGLHLSQLASLSYKVSNIDCLKRVVDALTALQHDMRTNAAYDSAFLEPVSRRHRFVSANSALHRRLAALRKRHQRRRHRRQQRSVNID